MVNNYYQNYSGYNNQYLHPRLFNGAIRTIIIANTIVFLFTSLFRTESYFLYYFGLVPNFVWSRGFVWQLFTYMFVHGGFGHLFMNMFVLWMFGSELEHTWGKKEFYKFYFISGIGSGIITMLFSLNSTIPVVGASGAIYAILVAFAMMYPNRLIYFYFLIPIRAKYFVLIMGVITFFSSFNQGAGGISHLTHLGGIIIGYLYLRRGRVGSDVRRYIPRIPRISFQNPLKKTSRKARPKPPPVQHDFTGTEKTMREELDRLLDKINKHNYDSLSETEKQNLALIGKYFADKDKMKN